MKVNTGMCVILTYVFSASLGLKQLTFQLQVKRSSSWGEKVAVKNRKVKVVCSYLKPVPYVVAKFAKLQLRLCYHSFDEILHKLKTVSLKLTKGTQ